MVELQKPYGWPRDMEYYYSLWSLASFLGIICINHIFGKYIFDRLFPAYRKLSQQKKIEWNCRVSSSIHASIVTLLCILSLVFDRTQWVEPITSLEKHLICVLPGPLRDVNRGSAVLAKTVSRPGCIALSISVGYMLADIITMNAFQKGLQLYLFTIHHIVVAICFSFLLAYRIAPIYAIIRLTCEISTPFLNQRWFYWIMGGEDADRKAAIATLAFTVLFILGRYILPIPYWYVFFNAFNSEVHLTLKPHFPTLTNVFITCPVLLDVLNIVWGIPIYGIMKKALVTLGYVKTQQNGDTTDNGSVSCELNGSIAPVSNGKVHEQ